MSVWAKAWAYEQHPRRIEDGKVTDKKHPAAKSVLVALAEYPGVGQRSCWPSQATLAQMTDQTERQVRRCLSDLEVQGLIKRTERRRQDGTRRSDTVTLLGPAEAFGPASGVPQDGGSEHPDERAGRGLGQPDESVLSTGRERPYQPDESSGHEPSVRNRQEEPNDSSLRSESADVSKEPSPMPMAMPMGQFGIKELAERTNAARERGAQIHSTTDRERRDFGAQFKRAGEDGHDLDKMLLALDYMVAKASGEIENEPKAWCGYRTALDRVIEGWRPARPLRALRNPEHERMVEENERLEAELLKGIA